VPANPAALTVTAELPVEVRVTGNLMGVLRESLPKLKLVMLNMSTGFV
jgi:hypothetical protein